MQRARRVEEGRQAAGNRGAERSAPRSTPLTIVSGAVAGDDLESLAASASEELGQPVVIAIPGIGEPIVSPGADLAADALAGYVALATDAIDSGTAHRDDDAVPIRIGDQT